MYSRVVRIPLVPSIKGNLALPRVKVQTGLQDRVDRCVAINTNPSRGSILQNTSQHGASFQKVGTECLTSVLALPPTGVEGEGTTKVPVTAVYPVPTKMEPAQFCE